MTHRRIDVHQHLVPPDHAAWRRSRGIAQAGGRELTAWSGEEALRVMDAHDVAGALAEAVHALDVLGASGVVLLANTHGTYLAAPEHEPLLEELARREAVVFVHPSTLPAPPAGGIPLLAAALFPGLAHTRG